MTPDWYVDPLGRYEGRYFDGEQWTAQVKDRGRLVIDPDWDRPAADASDDSTATGSDVEAAGINTFGGEIAPAETADVGFEAPARSAIEPIAPAPIAEAAPTLTPVDETTAVDRAVAAGAVDYSQESPARQVAVLDDPTAEVTPATVSDTIGADADTGGTSSRRWLYVLGVAILALALLVILLPRLLGGNDETADVDDVPVAVDDDAAASDADTEDAMDSADEGALPATDATTDTSGEAETDDDAAGDATDAADAADAGTAEGDDGFVDDPNSDALMVGSLEILNAKPVLRDLAVWHESSLTGRDVTLGDEANCWLGSIGEAVVQNAHCGPVATTPGAEPRFDLVPLRFEDVSDGVIQIRPITDAVVIDAVLPNGLELIGREGPVDPASFTAPAGGTDSDGTEAPDDGSGDGADGDSDAGNSDGRGSRGERETGD